MGTCASSLWQHTRSTLCAASTGEPERDRTVQSSALCAGSLNRQGTMQTWSAIGTCEAVRHFRCGLLVPGVLQQLWIDVSVRCPHAERYNKSASKPGVARVAGEAEKTKRYGMAVRVLVFETYGIEGTKLLRDLVTMAAANGQCSPHAVGRWRTQLERVLLTAQAGTEPPLLLTE